MKKNLLLLASLFFSLVSSAQEVDENGYTTVPMTMGAGYSNRVFFDFSENNMVSQIATNWDIAFYRATSQDFGVRINDAKNAEVYQVSATASDWETISIANEESWGDPLYNPDNTEDLFKGAFDQSNLLTGPMDFGWGTYNTGNHHIEGKVIFVIKYLVQGGDATYKKFMIEDYFGGYTFKYASWDGTAWNATQTATVANGAPTLTHDFNYYSFDTNAVVTDNEPVRENWDIVFTRYWTFYMDTMMYRLSGVIQNPLISVARIEETQATATFELPADEAYSNNITAIGHTWKPTQGVYDNVVYYIKRGDRIYRMYFIENGGTANGNMSFKFKDVTPTANTIDFDNNSFSIYPNPSVNKNVTVALNSTIENANVSVYSITGAKVFETSLTSNNQELNLSSLNSGIYLVRVEAGKYTEVKRLVIQ